MERFVAESEETLNAQGEETDQRIELVITVITVILGGNGFSTIGN